MRAAGVGLYGLALVRRGHGAPRYVAQLGAGGRGIGPWETDCLDLTSGEEFTVSSTDPEMGGPTDRRHRPPRRDLGRLAARRRGPADPSRLQRQRARSDRRPRPAAPPGAHRRQRPRASEPVRMNARDVDEANARWDRDMKRALASLQADTILRDLKRLRQDWTRYQRRFAPPAPGQLDLFTDAR